MPRRVFRINLLKNTQEHTPRESTESRYVFALQKMNKHPTTQKI